MVIRKAAFIGVIVLAIVAACGWAAARWSVSQRQRSYSWRQIQSPDRAFRISFPGEPSASQEENTALDGSKFKSNRLAVSPDQGVVYALSWWANDAQKKESTNALFSHVRQCDADVFHGRVVKDEAITFLGYPAKDIEIETASGRVVENRVVRADSTKMYSLFVIDSSAHLKREDVDKFFSSLNFR